MFLLFEYSAESHNSRLALVKGLETEVKIEIASPRLFRRKLREAGFRIHRRRVFERNAMFETEPPTLRPRGCIVRLREAGGRFTLTYKGPATVARHKSREEIEFTVSDAAAAQARSQYSNVWAAAENQAYYGLLKERFKVRITVPAGAVSVVDAANAPTQ